MRKMVIHFGFLSQIISGRNNNIFVKFNLFFHLSPEYLGNLRIANLIDHEYYGFSDPVGSGGISITHYKVIRETT